MRVAYFSPLPPERTGIADYSELLLPELGKRIDVATARRGARHWPRGTDVALYHIGNDVNAHGWIVTALRRRRGIVVLHDFVLHHLVAGLTLSRGDSNGYLDAMQRDAGVAGRLIAHGVIDGVVPPVLETRPQDFPLAAVALDHAAGVIVHSRYAESRVRDYGFSGPVWRVPHPAWPPPADLEPLPLPRNASVVIGCFGNLSPSKRLPQLLRAFAEVRRRHEDALLVLAGGMAPGCDLEPHASESGLRLGESVVHLGFVADRDIWPLLAACDVLVNLRWPTMGETSGSAIRALGAGRPLVVSDVGWFSELPDAVAAKVPVDADEVHTLAAFLGRLAGDPGLRARMGRSSAAYVRAEHGLARVADHYAAVLEEAVGGDLVSKAVLSDVAVAATEVGLDARSPELGAVGSALREVGLGR